MMASICNRSPGRSLALDATFRVAKQSVGDAKCMVFGLGEAGHIVTYAALESDSWGHILPLLVRSVFVCGMYLLAFSRFF